MAGGSKTAPPDWSQGDQPSWSGEPNYWVPSVQGGVYNPKDLVYPTKGGNLPNAKLNPPQALPASAKETVMADDQGKPSWEPSWLWHGARALGGAMSHIPGLGGVKKTQENFNWGDALKTAGTGGLEAGGATFLGGLAAGLPSGLGSLGGIGAGARGALGAARSAPGALFGLAKAHPLMALAGLYGGSKLISGLHGTGAGQGTNMDPTDLRNGLSAIGVNISGDEAKARMSALKGFTDLGYSQQEAVAQVFPEVAKHMQTQQNLLTQQITQFMNPYVQQVRSAAADQAKILTGLLPSVARRYRPVLQAYIGGEQQMANAGAANQALAALSGGVGFPEMAPSGASGGGTGNLSQLLQLAQQAGGGQPTG